MNFSPPMIFQDPAPCASTAAVSFALEQTMNPDKILKPVDFEELANRPFWLRTIYVDKSTPLQTTVYSKAPDQLTPNVVTYNDSVSSIMEATWNDVRNCHASYGIPSYKFIFMHCGSNEIKGKFRFDTYNHIVDYNDGPVKYDESRLRNSHFYWDLEKSSTCAFTITPIANFGSFKRSFATQQVIDFVSETSEFPVSATRNNNRDLYADVVYNGSFQMKLDESLVYPNSFPGTIPIVIFQQITYTPTFLKSYQEPIGAVVYPPYNND